MKFIVILFITCMLSCEKQNLVKSPTEADLKTLYPSRDSTDTWRFQLKFWYAFQDTVKDQNAKDLAKQQIDSLTTKLRRTEI